MQQERPTTQTCNKCGNTKDLAQFYFRKDTGKPKATCKECVKAQAGKYREQNREEITEKMRRYREEHPDVRKATEERYRDRHREELAERSREYYQDNRESVLEYRRKWAKANKDKVREMNDARRAKDIDAERDRVRAMYRKHYAKRYPKIIEATNRRKSHIVKATPSWADMADIREKYREAREKTDQSGVLHHVDHIVPLRGETVSGLHCAENMQVIPAEDNRRKRNYFG